MGRRKLEVKRIEDKCNRQVTFSKRQKGLLKKANELAVLCDVDVAVYIFTHRGRVYDFTTGESLKKISELQKKRGDADFASESLPDPTEAKLGAARWDTWTINDHLKFVESELARKKSEQLNMLELTGLEDQLDALLWQAKARKAQVTTEVASAIPENVH